MLFEGNLAAKVLFVSDFQRINCSAEGRVLGAGLMKLLQSAIKQAGLLESDYAFACIHARTPKGGKDVWKLATADREADINEFKAFMRTHAANVVVPLGEYCLQTLCELTGIAKWQSNVVKLKAEFEGRKAVPLFHPEHTTKVFSDTAFLAFGCNRIKQESSTTAILIPARTFKLGPHFEEAMDWLSGEGTRAEDLAIDFETGAGLINTVGFATSATNAIALKTLPEFYEPEQYLKLWQAIARLLESKQPKILQNFIYEATWAARYGIQLQNTTFDTMWAMKFLHPEFEKGLDNVGRIYTPYPYWKDDNDDWTNIRDWYRHLDYNAKDTTGTYAAKINQEKALKERGLYELFSGFIMRFAPIAQEMSVRGMRVDPVALSELRDKYMREHESATNILKTEFTARLGREVNPRSWQQLRPALKELGMNLPMKYDKRSGDSRESSDKKALVKLRRQHPDEPVLPALIKLSAANKQISSYIDFEYDREASRVHYQLDACSTETGRWSGHLSGWGTGFNPQTVPAAARKMFIADPGKILMSIDLKSAESFYVAFEGPEPTLMQLLLEGRSPHNLVAGKIFGKPAEMIQRGSLQYQLGKKAGHASNYGTGANTFAEMCLVELNHYITRDEAQRMLSAYFELFPGIRTRQQNVKKEICNKRFLKTPIGRERYFYGRLDDNTFREAYAFCPQSTIPDITNHLMLKLNENRDYLGLALADGNGFLLQTHDSLLIQTDPERVAEIADYSRDLRNWHPKINLAGGELWIPVDVEAGTRWKPMEAV